ncbi:uncharacterized protein BBOV_IV012150 [Babesia bovis T2Bo]|uniref:uncharacterized protein n=1 Tax=Babesia bovis T2Bo TaxID=484906 RepID=UPI001DFFEB62|nr:uncharacterized protein BBOV_IV012150 [Babesia bovis T2Bo]EDO07567.2 hypothetical protein BBOV_IV012150 [Babesia bovis T2Bo]
MTVASVVQLPRVPVQSATFRPIANPLVLLLPLETTTGPPSPLTPLRSTSWPVFS